MSAEHCNRTPATAQAPGLDAAGLMFRDQLREYEVRFNVINGEVVVNTAKSIN